MIVLLDANVLLRLAEPTSSLHPIASLAVGTLRTQGAIPVIVPQSLYEFWAVTTRPVANNGMGLSASECMVELSRVKGLFRFLDDRPTLYQEWESVVCSFACQGKAAHEARYVAAMRTHALTHILTFNTKDFTRYSGINVLDPTVLAAQSSTGP